MQQGSALLSLGHANHSANNRGTSVRRNQEWLANSSLGEGRYFNKIRYNVGSVPRWANNPILRAAALEVQGLSSLNNRDSRSFIASSRVSSAFESAYIKGQVWTTIIRR